MSTHSADHRIYFLLYFICFSRLLSSIVTYADIYLISLLAWQRPPTWQG